MEPETPSKSKLQFGGFSYKSRFRKLATVSIFIILILGIVCGILILQERIWMPEKASTFFTVVLDCGSTGSRVNVFEWRIGNKTKAREDLPDLLRIYPDYVNKSNGCQYHCMQTEPGLHNFVNDELVVRASLEPLIRYAETRVPLDRRSETPIFVLATAGMRWLDAKDAGKILKNVGNVVQEHGFMHRKIWIRVLSGKEEAYYGWVALNYKMGIFRSMSRISTLGLLDLGGSSLQVVAEVDIPNEDEHASLKSKIGPFEHDIVAYSLPAFGLNKAFDRTVVMLSHTQAVRENSEGVREVRHPCLGSGYLQNYTCRSCFALESHSPGNLSNSVFLVGEPNWEMCEMVSRAAAINSSGLEFSQQSFPRSNCMGLFSYGGNTNLNLTKNLHAVSRYHALSGFFAVSRALNLSRGANLSTLWEKGQHLCSRPKSDQESINGHNCFRVPYLTSLIENTLCLGGTEVIFGPGDVSWTLGASLIEGDFLWVRAGKFQNRFFTLKGNMIIPSPLLTFVLLLSLLLIVYCCQIKFPMPGRKINRTSLPSFLGPKLQHN